MVPALFERRRRRIRTYLWIVSIVVFVQSFFPKNRLRQECENGKPMSLDPMIHDPKSLGSQYYKWEQTAKEMSSSDELSIPGGPRVTRLKQPSRVTFGGGTDAVLVEPESTIGRQSSVGLPPKRKASEPLIRDSFDYSRWDRIAEGVSDTFVSGDDAELEYKREKEEERRQLFEDIQLRMHENGSSASINSSLWDQGADMLGNLTILESAGNRSYVKEKLLTKELMTENGAERSTYFWRQDDREVDVFIRIPSHITHKQIEVKRMEFVQPAPNVEIRHFLNITINGKLYFKRQIAYEVKYEKAYQGGLMWSVRECEGGPNENAIKLVQVTLIKNHKMHKFVKHWWPKAFKDEPEINVKYLKSRGDPEKANKFRDVWDKAHEEFRERMKHREKIPIPVGKKDYDKAKKFEEELNKRRVDVANRWALPGVVDDDVRIKAKKKPGFNSAPPISSSDVDYYADTDDL